MTTRTTNQSANNTTPKAVIGYDGQALVVADADVAAADVILGQQMGPGWTGGFLYRQPPWDGFSEPEPPADCRAEVMRGRSSDVDPYRAACAVVCAQIASARTFDFIAVNELDPVAFPRNTLDDVYAGQYNPALPVESLMVATALWYLQVQGQLPPRTVFDAVAVPTRLGVR